MLRTVLRQATDLASGGPARGRRLARAAHRSAEVTGDLRAVPRLLADARRADPHADTRLPWVTAAAAKQLHGDGDIDTSHRVLLEALESRTLDGSLDDDVVDALHLLRDVCAAGGRDELWAPVLRLLERLHPQLPDTLRVPAAATPALDPLLTAVDGLADERDPRRIVRIASAAFDLDRGTACADALRRVVADGRSGGAVASAITALRSSPWTPTRRDGGPRPRTSPPRRSRPARTAVSRCWPRRRGGASPSWPQRAGTTSPSVR